MERTERLLPLLPLPHIPILGHLPSVSSPTHDPATCPCLALLWGWTLQMTKGNSSWAQSGRSKKQQSPLPMPPQLQVGSAGPSTWSPEAFGRFECMRGRGGTQRRNSRRVNWDPAPAARYLMGMELKIAAESRQQTREHSGSPGDNGAAS